MTKPIQLLDDLGAEFARAFAHAERSPRRRRLPRPGVRGRTLSIALAIVVLLAGTAAALPAARAVVGGITAPFAAWFAGGDASAPGRAVQPGDNTPFWFHEGSRWFREGEVRLIAETEGVGLYVQRVESDQGPALRFSLGQGMGMGGTLTDLRQKVGRDKVYVLGWAAFGSGQGIIDDRGRVPLFGLTTRDAARVALTYADGSSLVGEAGDGGFVLLADAWRPLREVVAYGANGDVLGRTDVSRYDLRYLCEKEPGCPPTGAAG